MSPTVIDSHCHLQYLEPHKVKQSVADAIQNGVSHMICVSVDLDNHAILQNFAHTYKEVFFSYGVHPLHAGDIQDVPEDQKCVALGETGLDYYRGDENSQQQINSFEKHLFLAQKHDKAVIIHSRNAKKDTISVLRRHPGNRVVLHSFAEDVEMLKEVMALETDLYVSFSGIVTFKNANSVQEAAKYLPLDRILVETDTPYLSPHPLRGAYPNLPQNTMVIAKFLSELRNEDLTTFCRTTKENTIKLFNMSSMICD